MIILTSTPYSMARSMVSLVSGRGGSRKVKIPIMVHLPSSLVRATARERIPRRPRSITCERGNDREKSKHTAAEVCQLTFLALKAL